MNVKVSRFVICLLLVFAPTIFFFAVNAAHGGEREVLYKGQWESDGFFTTLKGSWEIVREGNQKVLVLGDDFKTSKGPDLKIFLSKLPLDKINGNNAAGKGTSVRVAELKDFSGKSAYVIPPGVVLHEYKSVVIHCEAYSKLWGGSSLEKVG